MKLTFSPKQTFGQANRVRAYLTALDLGETIKIPYDEWNLKGWYHPHLMDMMNQEDKRHEDEEYYNYIIGQRDHNDVNAIYTVEDAVFSACF